MRLPREIRNEIYKLVLAPLLCKHKFSKGEKRDLVLHIFGFEDEYYKPKATEVESMLHPLAIGSSAPHRKRSLDPQLRAKFEEEQKQVAALCKRFLHPTRAEYQLSFPVNWSAEKYAPRASWEKIPPVLLASVRTLSNVSCQIRQELAICAWARSFLIIDLDENYYPSPALECLKERPAIWKGINTVLLRIPEYGISMELEHLLEFMEKHLQLDLLVLKFRLFEEETVTQGDHADRKWVTAFQHLSCTRAFHIILDDEESSDDEDLRDSKVAALEEMLTPLVLRGCEKELQVDESEEPKSTEDFRYRLQPDGSFSFMPNEVEREFEFEKYRSPSPTPSEREEWNAWLS